jgi:hypothetical protein
MPFAKRMSENLREKLTLDFPARVEIKFVQEGMKAATAMP